MKDYFVKIWPSGYGAKPHKFLRDKTQAKGKHGRHPIALFDSLASAVGAAERETAMSGHVYEILGTREASDDE
jgi:hypothetical protein